MRVCEHVTASESLGRQTLRDPSDMVGAGTRGTTRDNARCHNVTYRVVHKLVGPSLDELYGRSRFSTAVGTEHRGESARSNHNVHRAEQQEIIYNYDTPSSEDPNG